jgi:hypothetical protein
MLPLDLVCESTGDLHLRLLLELVERRARHAWHVSVRGRRELGHRVDAGIAQADDLCGVRSLVFGPSFLNERFSRW